MERLPISGEKILKSGSYFLDLAKTSGPLSIGIENNANVDVLLLNLKNADDLHFDVPDYAFLNVSMLCKESAQQFKISANVGQNSKITAYFADFIPGQVKGNVSINLNKENASCDWHLASLTDSTDKKVFDVSIYHNSIGTTSHLDNYGVVRDDGKLEFSGICKIVKGSHRSKAHQNAKIMVFDKLSDGIAKPILKIDDNDIEASHAAVVGKINDEHIFYLTSRGLSVDEAKRIITLGYLKPILNGFSDEEMKKEIENIIEGNMQYVRHQRNKKTVSNVE